MSDSFSKIHHIGIVVQSLEASEAWYADMLGFKRLHSFSFPGVRAAFIGRGDLKIELFENEQAAPMDEKRQMPHTNLAIGGINHFAIQVDNLDDIIATLQAKGVEVVSPPKDVPGDNAGRYAFIHDNERMLVELFQPA